MMCECGHGDALHSSGLSTQCQYEAEDGCRQLRPAQGAHRDRHQDFYDAVNEERL